MKKQIILRILVLLVGSGASATAQDMRENLNRSLFSDQKANRVGDAVTVLILESTIASNDARTLSSRESGFKLGANANTGSGSNIDVSGGLGTGNQFRGEGATSTRGSVRAKLSAQVDSILANGNLVISGRRKVSINGEEQTMTLNGIVRPSDIMADNAVYSFNIAEATIVVEGDGIVSRAQGPGWLTKIFHWLF